MERIEVQLANTVPGIGVEGQRVTLSLTPQDIRDATEIPDYLAGYSPGMYRADEVSKPILVDNDEDKYRTFDSDDAFRRVYVKGSMQGAVPEVDPKSSLSSYKVVERYIGSFVPRQVQLQRPANNSYQPVLAASRRCKRAIMLDREVDVFTLLGTSGNWNANQQTAAAGTGWADQTNGDPILDVQNMVEKTAQPITEIWMNQKIANRFMRHQSVRTYMKQYFGDSAQPGLAAALASGNQLNIAADFVLPGLPTIRIASAKVKNESTGLLQYVLGDVVIAVTVPPGGMPSDGEEIASSYTFRRRGISGTGLDVREYEVDGRGPLGGTMIVVATADIPVITANNAGGILTGV